VYQTANGRFQARIRVDGRVETHGTFDDDYWAARAYDRRAREIGRFSNLNFPDGDAPWIRRAGGGGPGVRGPPPPPPHAGVIDLSGD